MHFLLEELRYWAKPRAPSLPSEIARGNFLRSAIRPRPAWQLPTPARRGYAGCMGHNSWIARVKDRSGAARTLVAALVMAVLAYAALQLEWIIPALARILGF